MPETKTNALYYGDNLDILRKHIPDESVDLVYLDPPFNSKADYNVLFKEPTGEQSAAQLQAFSDTWHWDETAERTFQEIALNGPLPVAKMVSAMQDFIGRNDMMAYLVMMTVRLVELRRILTPTGSLYLHCDPTAGHYLKIVLDALFGPKNFRNEIVWRRSHPKGHAFTRFARNHDVMLSFAKDCGLVKWNQQYTPHHPERVTKQYSHSDETGRRYQLTSLLNPNKDRPNLTYEFKGVTKVWRWTRERMLQEDANGRIVVPRAGRGIARYKRYLDEQEGIPVADF
jgi:site-specific DNA-methyltransferase (adenine-specific)